MTDDRTSSPRRSGVDISAPHYARVYDYWLGGKDNFIVDRAVGDAMIRAVPRLHHTAAENRRFVHRVTRYLAAEEGIRQFLDIGIGLPHPPNLHEIAQDVDPTARIVYVDNDPIVLVHASALMTSHPDGHVAYLDADLRNPATILTDPTLCDTLDLNRPVGLTLIATLMLLADTDDPWSQVDQLRDALPSGSYLAITHPTADFNPAGINTAIATATDAGMPLTARAREAVQKFFGDWELLCPGLCPVSAWRPDEPVNNLEAAHAWAGVARKR
ncbi:SAM-dependent methyltransferase [Actinoplanes subglobosus]|uniref:SAM-dependent methyltransferase n=1 Tax=Actinoplanes subglobosus TaxID=1547892 RepID=A0ABV8IKR0_9ACTN